MLFRNLALFRIGESALPRFERLADGLDDHRLRHIGPLEMSTRGAVPPLDDDRMVYADDRFALFCVGAEEKLLPASVINDALKRKIEQINRDEARPVTGRERKKLKSEILDRLLPRAFARPSRTHAYLDRKDGWLVMDTSSRAAAERVLTLVRDGLGSFPAVPLAPNKPPRQLMTSWLTSGDLPARLVLTNECVLRDPAGAGTAKWSGRDVELDSEAVQEHLRAGKQVYQLGLEFDGRMSFVLGEDLIVRKLRFFDNVTDELSDQDITTPQQEMETRFTLMTRELARLLSHLETWFDLRRPVS